MYLRKSFCFILMFSSIDCSKRKKRRDEGVFIHFLEESFVGKKEEAGGGKKAPPLHQFGACKLSSSLSSPRYFAAKDRGSPSLPLAHWGQNLFKVLVEFFETFILKSEHDKKSSPQRSNSGQNIRLIFQGNQCLFDPGSRQVDKRWLFSKTQPQIDI